MGPPRLWNGKLMNEHCQKWNLDPAKLPRHVGIIMDGNGRWASARHLPRLMGHKKGVERVREISEMAGALGVEALTLYAFSDENWKRPEEEIGGLMNLLRSYIKSDKERLVANRVCFRMIGERTRLPADVQEIIASLEQQTVANSGLKLNVALSYGGRAEIVRAARKIAQKVQHGEIQPAEISFSHVEECLDTAGLPPVDLLVRTSGECRVSNFLLWQIAYAELAFENAPWPEFSSEVFARVLREFGSRERRFGLTSAQIASGHKGFI
jgi:undecaprenyl diphosphate synthase